MVDVLEVRSTITTVSGEEDKAYGEFRVTLTGTEGENYSSNQNEYEEMSLVKVPENAE